jgi:programmed cell death 6-interacting protein
MLKIPFKQADPISYTKPLEQAIREVFQEDPDTYSDDLEELHQLRLAIQDPQDHEASANTHLAYYCQLHYLESKFQFDEDHVNLFFTWANAFGVQDSVSSHNIGFEKASVLFNLGAIYNHLAILAGSSGDEAIKKSAYFFQQSAGVYQTISDKLVSWNILGNANTQLNALSNLNLAQAQEVFLTKATNQKMKEGTLAKLSMQVSQFYAVAYEIASNTEIFNKSWLSHMQMKQHHFAALAQFYKSMEVEAQGKYGEQVGWLNASLNSMKAALDKGLVKYIQNDAYLEELKALQSKIEVQHQKANKDNDKIYMEAIPKELPPLPPARMVNPILVPEVKDLSNFVSRPFFRHLVPYKVHQAVSKYSYKKDMVVKGLISKLTEATTIAHTTLASQRLPASIEALEQPIGLPSLVLERSRELREKGGSRYLDASWETLMSFSNKDGSMLKEALAVLAKESSEDDELRRLHGPKWTRTPSQTLTVRLHEQGKEYREKMDAANQSNAIVKKKMEQSLHLIQSLELDQKELEASIPSSTQTSTLALKDPNLKELKQLLDLLNTNIKKKKELAEKIKKSGEADDIGTFH